MEDTLHYYNINAEAFMGSTRDVGFEETQNKFLRYLKHGDRVLDFGCGSGRDTKYFLSQGFLVDAVDGSEELVKLASKYTQIEVKQMLFQDLNVKDTYDGIWACSSILHLAIEELIDVLKKMGAALVSQGVIYTSFKYGTEEGFRNGRFFTNMTEDKINKLLEKVDMFFVEEIWVTSDVRPEREDEKWLNLILRKKM